MAEGAGTGGGGAPTAIVIPGARGGGLLETLVILGVLAAVAWFVIKRRGTTPLAEERTRPDLGTGGLQTAPPALIEGAVLRGSPRPAAVRPTTAPGSIKAATVTCPPGTFATKAGSCEQAAAVDTSFLFQVPAQQTPAAAAIASTAAQLAAPSSASSPGTFVAQKPTPVLQPPGAIPSAAPMNAPLVMAAQVKPAASLISKPLPLTSPSSSTWKLVGGTVGSSPPPAPSNGFSMAVRR